MTFLLHHEPELVADVDAADADPLAELWLRYKGSGDRGLREQLILHYAPLVTVVASRISHAMPSSVELADLVSYGMFGLIDAVEKFDPDRAVKFETYAARRIRGSIIDELRSADWVPRSVRTKARDMTRAYSELENRLHRGPTERELAEHLGVTVSEVRSGLRQLSTMNLVALDELLAGRDGADTTALIDTMGDAGRDDPAGRMEDAETVFLLARAIEQLSERERVVLVLYYYEAMTLAEIGRVLGVTESRVSQIHSAVMLRLRTKLTECERC